MQVLKADEANADRSHSFNLGTLAAVGGNGIASGFGGVDVLFRQLHVGLVSMLQFIGCGSSTGCGNDLLMIGRSFIAVWER